MADAMAARRHALHAALVEVGAPGCWDHIAAQRGMFSFTGLTRVRRVPACCWRGVGEASSGGARMLPGPLRLACWSASRTRLLQQF